MKDDKRIYTPPTVYYTGDSLKEMLYWAHRYLDRQALAESNPELLTRIDEWQKHYEQSRHSI